MIYIFIKSGWGYYQTIRPSDHQTTYLQQLPDTCRKRETIL